MRRFGVGVLVSALLAAACATASAEPGQPGMFTADDVNAARAALQTVAVNVDTNRLVDGQPLAGAAYRVTAQPIASTSPGGLIVGGGDLVTTGTLDSAGAATLMMPATAEGQFFVFALPAYGPQANWPFQVTTTTGPLDLHDLVDAYYRAHPDGDPQVTYRPTPGPAGDQGPQGLYEVEVYAVAATRPAAPTGGIVRVATAEIVTLPTGTPSPARGPPDVPDGDKLWISRARINPATASAATVTPVWLPYAESGGSGPPGPQGTRGWTPTVAIALNGDRRVIRITGWVGGTGDPPPLQAAMYVGSAGVSLTIAGVTFIGLTADIADAVDVRGAQGAPGNVVGAQRTYVGAADPSLGTDPTLAAAAVGSLYIRSKPLAIEVWEKTGAGGQAWTRRTEHDLDAGQLIPAGGTIGQVIGKTGAGDYNRGWIDAAAPGPGPSDPYTGVAPITVTGTEISLNDLGVTAAKLGPSAVTGGKIGTAAVSAAKIGTSAVTQTKIANNAVIEAKLAAAVRAKLNAEAGVTVVETLPPLTAALDGRLYEITSTQQLVRIRGHSAADATADWAALPPNFSFGAGKTYQGARNARTDAPRMIPSNHVWFIRDSHNFITGDANQRAIYYGPPQGYIGSKDGEAQATHDLTADGQIASWALPDNPSEFPYRASNWVAAVTTEWHPVVIGDPVAIARSFVAAAVPEGTTTVEFTRNDGSTQELALPAVSPDSLPIPSQLPNETLFAVLDRIFIFDDGADEWRTSTLDAFRTYIIGALRNVVATALVTERDSDRVIVTTVSGNRYQAIEDFAARMADEGVLITAHEGNTDRWARGKLPADVVYTEDLPDPVGPGEPELLYDNHDAAAGLTIRNFAASGQRTATEIQFTRALTAADAGKTIEIEAEMEGNGSARRFFSETIPVDQWLRAESAPDDLTSTNVDDMWSFFIFRSSTTTFTTWADSTISIQRRVDGADEYMRWRYVRSSGDPNWTNVRIEVRIK